MYVANEPVAIDCNISTTLTNVIADPTNPTVVKQCKDVTLLFTATSGYSLPFIVSVTGASYTWLPNSGKLVLTNITTDVSIEIIGEQVLSNQLRFVALQENSTVAMSVTGTPA